MHAIYKTIQVQLITFLTINAHLDLPFVACIVHVSDAEAVRDTQGQNIAHADIQSRIGCVGQNHVIGCRLVNYCVDAIVE